MGVGACHSDPTAPPPPTHTHYHRPTVHSRTVATIWAHSDAILRDVCFTLPGPLGEFVAPRANYEL